MMKNRQLLFVILVLCLSIFSAEAFSESMEVGHPLPGRIRVLATAVGTSKRIQISGSLRPLRVFINGKERTSELKVSECLLSSVNFNDKEIDAQGYPGIFYWEGVQTQEEQVLKLNVTKNCQALIFKIPLAFFEKGFKQEVYLPESERPSTWKIKLTGEKIEGVSLTMDQGILDLGEEWTYTHEIKPGETLVTGLLKDKNNNVTPLQLKFNLAIQSSDAKDPGLFVQFKQSAEDKVSIEGKVNSANKLLLNNEVVATNHDGTFSTKLSVKEGENVILVAAESSSGEQVSVTKKIKREFTPDVPWPILPKSTYIGIAPFSAHAFKAPESDLRFQDNLMSYLVVGMRLGENHHLWEFHIRYVEKMDASPSNRTNNFNSPGELNYTDHYGIGALRLFPWKKAFHFGLGMSYEQLKRNEYGSTSKNLYGIHLMGRIGWMKTFGKHWAWMPSWAPFIPIPFGQRWETYGFDLIPIMVLYTF